MSDYKMPPAPWRVVKAGGSVGFGEYTTTAEDDCIVDANGHEVIASSEWMRGRENLEFIVSVINEKYHLEKETNILLKKYSDATCAIFQIPKIENTGFVFCDPKMASSTDGEKS